ncbi:uncharacterized protein SPPG_08322 [Spizellomyces punctatus DAOM BR117]|uniref:VFL3 protein n=1 Tax=Spizellomyces punctatus (strain DAOM BR117) TaxID=645134 RepID=A0A0L0H4I6_SPIPD|nr:uncharacterized protein SPPG_08322 [Spizellomyces punctatus DAOM BR117]KNC96425.1 hypothetical protein SPPG_08322 [Spizellomyces punctatus DAOM BR117]|eukprot:XP_016604465.1 hypothetical protein SPPG_08322 [Spizellomyces punctatus DAOM BR117]
MASLDLGCFNEKAIVLLKGGECQLFVYGQVDGSVNGSEPSLSIYLECPSTGDAWHAKFSPAVIEDICKKTGNFKRFPVFVEMLLSSLRNTNKTVRLDFLTSADVESLKSGEVPETRGADFKEPVLCQEKVYMILTYAVAFDRVHYPLPLLHDKQPNSLEENRKGNMKLGSQLQHLETIALLMRENDRLKHELKHVACQPCTDSNTKELQSPRTARESNAHECLKEIERDLEKIRLEFPMIQKSFRRLRIDESISRLHVMITSLSKGIKGGSDDVRKGSRRRTSSSSERHAMHSSSVKSVPLERRVLRRSNRSKETVTSRNSEYRVVKSRPLRSPPASIRKTPSPSRGRQPSGRKSSPSAYRRFDPTLYVLERNRKLEERRARSRERSNSSTRSVKYRRDSASATATTGARASGVGGPYANGKNVNYDDVSRSRSKLSANRKQTGATARMTLSKDDFADWDLDTNLDTVDIDNRLASLYDYISTVNNH